MLLPTILFSALALGRPANQDATALYKKVKDAIVSIETDTGSGTGFFVNDGKYLLTAAHVIKDVHAIKLREERVEVVSVLFYDPDSDVAVLKVSSKAKRFLKVRSDNHPSPGTRTYVVGSPLGVLDKSISDGIVSAVRPLKGYSLIQFTAAVSPGSSGSPLLDSTGRVIGLVTGRLKEGESLNFATSGTDLGKAIKLATSRDVPERSAASGTLKTGTVIGKMGQTISEAPIYAKPSADSEVYYTTRRFQYLVINPSGTKGWLSVLLQNGKNGYIDEDQVAQLPYDVRTKGQAALPSRVDPREVPTSQAGAEAAKVAVEAEDWPYKAGGNDLRDGCDEEAFARLVFARVGIDLPSGLVEQQKAGRPVERIEQLMPGDRVFFWESSAKRVTDCGIFIGFEGEHAYFVHADKQAGKIKTADLARDEWRAKLVAARRS